MAGRKNIEALAVHFTAGVAAGTLVLRLPVNPYFLAGGLLIFLASLTAIVLRTERPALLFPAFFLLGAFCVLADAFPGVETATFPERWAASLGKRAKDFIDSIPFPSEGTAPLLKALLTGDRSGLSRETVQVFRESYDDLASGFFTPSGDAQKSGAGKSSAPSSGTDGTDGTP